jgi:hypothetical protein
MISDESRRQEAGGRRQESEDLGTWGLEDLGTWGDLAQCIISSPCHLVTSSPVAIYFLFLISLSFDISVLS